jgi:hypothetical protein
MTPAQDFAFSSGGVFRKIFNRTKFESKDIRHHLYIMNMPGPGTPGTWSQNGNSVTIRIQGLSKPGLGIISKTSTGFQLQIQDSVVNSVAVSIMTK